MPKNTHQFELFIFDMDGTLVNTEGLYVKSLILACHDKNCPLPEEQSTELIFGKSWGLASSVLDQADIRLSPVQGPSDYNHLSVRSAISIVLDRLLGH